MAEADLDGDGAFGLSADALISVSTDTAGDLLKKDDGNALYIIDDNDTEDSSDDITIAICEQSGTPTFDWRILVALEIMHGLIHQRHMPLNVMMVEPKIY